MTDRLTTLSSMATRQILAELAGDHERSTAVPVQLVARGGVDAARRVRAGEILDVVVLASPVMEQLEREGHVVAGSRADVARSGIAVAVPEAGPRPDIADGDAVRRAMLDSLERGLTRCPHCDRLLQRASSS